MAEGGFGVTVRFAVCILLALGGAATAGEPSDQDRAMALLNAGQRGEALHAFEAIIAARPFDPSEALFQAATIRFEDGNWQSAKPLAEQLVKLRPGSFVSWELMIQVYQAAADTEDRDLAIQSLYDAWHSAPDDETQTQIAFRRDRIAGPKHTVVARQTLDPGGDEILRYQFDPVDNTGPAAHLIVLRSDNDTNARLARQWHGDAGGQRLPSGHDRAIARRQDVRPIVRILHGTARLRRGARRGDADPARRDQAAEWRPRSVLVRRRALIYVAVQPPSTW